ncbi:MAG: choice-of-anchor family protein [Glaciihabitans sp.]|nr:choice-of-anchor family protein [Glaciihabitans sp.]
MSGVSSGNHTHHLFGEAKLSSAVFLAPISRVEVNADLSNASSSQWIRKVPAVLNLNTSHTGNGKQRAAHHFITKVVAVSATGALGTALALTAPLSASADTVPTSMASGQFLSGAIGGVSLDNIAAVGAASVHNNGSQGTQVSRDPLSVSALRTTLINQPGGVQLNLGDVIDLGALSQYAQANSDGSSTAASGAISNDGGIGVGTVGTNGSGSTSINLDSLLNARFAKVLTDMSLKADAVAAEASAKLNTASGKYALAGLTLNFTSPAIANLGSKVSSALAPVAAQIGELNGSNGDLAGSVNGVVSGISPTLDLPGAHATVSAKVSADLNAALKPLLTGIYGNGAVTFNLQTGAVSVDLAALLGGKLNSEPVGTQVLSDAVVNEILKGITGTIATLGDQIKAKVTNVLNNAQVDVDVALNESTAQAPLLGTSCVTGGAGGALGDLLSGTVGALLCTNTTKLLPNLGTSLDVHVHGTVGQIVDGTANQATATLKLLGVPVSVNVDNILSGMGGQLTNHLLDGSSAVSQLDNSLQAQLIDPAVTGLLGTNASVGNALTGALSVTLNNHDTSPTGEFTETALRVGVLPGGSATGGLARVNLAAATVGPNVTTVVAPGSPGDPGTPTSPGSLSAPGSPSNPITPAAFSNLAFTGVGIGMLVAAILALLAAGAYLVREGYRRNGRHSM